MHKTGRPRILHLCAVDVTACHFLLPLAKAQRRWGFEVEFAFPPVAVLTDSLTASSGEAITIAFRARPGARSFGQPTFGVSTANAAFGLSDGAAIFLTVATMADRSGALYGGELVPDSLVLGTKTGDRTTDAALDAAFDWLATVACN